MLRRITKQDIPKLLSIEKSAQAVPWTVETFETCFKAGYVGWVIELDEQLIGFIMVSFTQEECHILNLAIAFPYQKQGWGRKLIEYALMIAKERHTSIAYLEVRRSNSKAIALYKKLQFQLIGQRKDYYPTLGGNEDALVFAKRLKDNF